MSDINHLPYGGQQIQHYEPVNKVREAIPPREWNGEGPTGYSEYAIKYRGGNRGPLIQNHGFRGYSTAVMVGEPGGALDSEGRILNSYFQNCDTGIWTRHAQTKGWNVRDCAFVNVGTVFKGDGFPISISDCSVDGGVDAGMIFDVNVHNLAPLALTNIESEGLGMVGHFGHGNGGGATQRISLINCNLGFDEDPTKHGTDHLSVHGELLLLGGAAKYCGGAGAGEHDPFRLARPSGHYTAIWNWRAPNGGLTVTGNGWLTWDGVTIKIPNNNPTTIRWNQGTIEKWDGTAWVNW